MLLTNVYFTIVDRNSVISTILRCSISQNSCPQSEEKLCMFLLYV